jgi:transposase-like protein
LAATDGSQSRQRRSYSKAQREESLQLYTEVGPAEAGRRLGIPAATVRKWAQRAGTQSIPFRVTAESDDMLDAAPEVSCRCMVRIEYVED